MKVYKLADALGFHDPIDMIESYIHEDTMPAICTNKNCNWDTELEPDCTNGWCELCRTKTMTSAAVLMGIM